MVLCQNPDSPSQRHQTRDWHTFPAAPGFVPPGLAAAAAGACGARTEVSAVRLDGGRLASRS